MTEQYEITDKTRAWNKVSVTKLPMFLCISSISPNPLLALVSLLLKLRVICSPQHVPCLKVHKVIWQLK